jgi:Tfp pilus assembly protein PilV
MLEPLIAVLIMVIGVLALGVGLLAGIFYKFVATSLQNQQAFATNIVKSLILYQKADSAGQAVELELHRDIGQEALRDAYEKAKAEKEDDLELMQPKFVTTDDGRKIDLRDYEVV